jgi:hypothetical protein
VLPDAPSPVNVVTLLPALVMMASPVAEPIFNVSVPPVTSPDAVMSPLLTFKVSMFAAPALPLVRSMAAAVSVTVVLPVDSTDSVVALVRAMLMPPLPAVADRFGVSRPVTASEEVIEPVGARSVIEEEAV